MTKESILLLHLLIKLIVLNPMQWMGSTWVKTLAPNLLQVDVMLKSIMILNNRNTRVGESHLETIRIPFESSIHRFQVPLEVVLVITQAIFRSITLIFIEALIQTEVDLISTDRYLPVEELVKTITNTTNLLLG